MLNYGLHSDIMLAQLLQQTKRNEEKVARAHRYQAVFRLAES